MKVTDECAVPPTVVRQAKKRGRPTATPDEFAKGIQSVELAIGVLEAVFDAGEPVGLMPLCDATKMQPSKIHRYLVSLTRMGLLEKDAETATYELGPTMRRIGMRAFVRHDPIARAQQRLQELSNATGFTFLLYMWTEQGATLMGWYQGSDPLPIVFRLGSAVPLSSTAVGRAFLATMPEETVAPVIAREIESAVADRVDHPTASETKAAIRTIQQKGISTSSLGIVQGLEAIAAPVTDAIGNLECVIAVILHRRFLIPRTRRYLEGLILKTSKELIN